MAMKSNVVSILQATLLSASLALPALVLPVSANAAESEDGRYTIVLRPKERNAMLEDMRNYLHGIREITRSLAEGDIDEVEKAARRSGTIAIYEMKPVMSDAMVPRFRSLAIKVHEQFEQLADDAAAGQPPMKLLGDLGRLMNNCVKCHETYAIGSFSHQK